MSSGFTDWTDLGIFPLQDVEDGVPIGMRMAMVGGRVKKRPDAGAGGESLTTYAREGGLGTLGDIHPWLFWQTKEREKRPMGSWAMAWAALVIDASDPYYGSNPGVQPLTKQGTNTVLTDPRYRTLQPAWHFALPRQPKGMIGMVMPSTSETEPGSVMLSADRRLVASAASGPGEAGTTIVDMQPRNELCMGDSTTPGQGGRHARLQALVRVIAMSPSSARSLGSNNLNSIALNFGRSQQDGIVGYGMIYGPAGSGGGGGPTTGGSAPPGQSTGPITQTGGGPGAGSPDAPEANPPGFGSNSSDPSDAERSVGSFGVFSPAPWGGNAVGFMSGAASGPITHGCGKHQIGTDKDGHIMSSAHISTNAYFWEPGGGRDGPIEFGGTYPDASASSIPTEVYLSYDEKTPHGFVNGQRSGMWRMWTTVPFVQAEEEEDKLLPGRRPDTWFHPPNSGLPAPPSTPSSPGAGQPSGPGAPQGPSTPGAGAPGKPGAPGVPTGPIRPGEPTAPPWNDPRGPIRPGAPLRQPRGPIRPGPAAGASPRGPIRPGGLGDLVNPPVSEPGGPTDPRGPIRPGAPTVPNAPKTPEYLSSPDSNFPVSPGSTVFAGRGTEYNTSLLETFADTIQERGRGPAGVVNEVGGSAAGRDVGLYGVFHPYSNGFAAISFRPQLWIKGAPNFEHNPRLNPTVYRNEEKTRPSTLTIRAWGAQSQSGDWDYLTHPSVARPRGGNVNGGLLISPAEFEMEDYLGIASSVDTDNPVAATYAMLAPKVNLAFGKPTTTGRPSASSKSIHLDTAGGELKVSELDAAGAATGIAGFDVDADGEGHVDLKGTGSVGLPAGTTAQQPSSPSAGDFRYNSTDKTIEFYDGAAWQQPGGAGATPNQDRAVMFPLVQGPGSYTTERVLFKCIPVAGDITNADFHCTDVLTANSNNYWIFRIYRDASVVASLSNELSTISAGTLTSMGSLSNESFDGTQELRISVQTVHDTGNARSLNGDYLTFDIKMSID